MKSAVFIALFVATACGGDDSDEGTKPPPKCASDAKLSGGVSVDASVEYDCADGGGFATTADHVTVEVRLPGDQPGVLSVRMFGLNASTAPGTTLSAGVALDLGLPPTEHWEAGMDTATACSALIERQDAGSAAGELVVTASVSCTAELMSATTPPVIVERLDLRALYEP